MKALSKDQDSGDSKPHRKGAKEGDADARRKPKPGIAAKTSPAKKKAPKKNKPSRAERKASKAQK